MASQDTGPEAREMQAWIAEAMDGRARVAALRESAARREELLAEYLGGFDGD